jgi:regulator of RNase E activity RraA
MNFITSPEDMILMTPEWKGERFPDGRPKVPDSILERLRKVKTEEAWFPMWGAKYKFQFEGDFKIVHPEKVMVGRALTAVMVPSRPDVHMALLKHGREEHGYHGFFNQWTIEHLAENDILVVDMCDKIINGTYVGGNLSTAIKSKAGPNGGAVIWGGIRDLQQIVDISGFQCFYRGVDPTPIGDVMLSGINKPCRIGKAICMPGDVVLGTMSGVLFIPAHMAEESAIIGEKQQCKDIFGFERLADGVYTSSQIDAAVWAKDIMDDFINWFKISPKAEDYQYLDWTKEIERSQSVSMEDFTGLS